jgi:hypothetical protein
VHAQTPGGLKTKIMKITTLTLALLITVSMYGQADFSGTWKFNAEKSQLNNTPGVSAVSFVKIVIEQTEGTITYQRNDRPKETLKIDSTASIDITEGDHRTNVSMKLAADKKGLVETRIYTYPESETAEVAAKKTRIWTLSPDKKTLTITDNIESTKGNVYLIVLVYEKEAVSH